MVKHIVFFKLKDKSPEVEKELQQKLLSLKEHIDFLKEIEVGINFKESERAYDLALVTVFENEEDLSRYATHPYHLEVLKYIKTVVSDTKVVDFKY
ncbi:MAG: Dabb family protein [Sulfurospirillum sp.]|nr:MAG: Dabb family protein [Sulfurospirillum sp.]